MRKKNSFTLIEILVSIILVTIIIGSSLQLNQNNLKSLDMIKSSSLNDTLITLSVHDGENRNTKITLSDKVHFYDDKVINLFKKSKIKIKDDLEYLDIPENEYIQEVQITKSVYTLNNSNSKNFYKLKFK